MYICVWLKGTEAASSILNVLPLWRLCVCVCVWNKHLQSGCLLTPELSGTCSLCDATLTDQSETEEMTTDLNVNKSVLMSSFIVCPSVCLSQTRSSSDLVLRPESGTWFWRGLRRVKRWTNGSDLIIFSCDLLLTPLYSCSPSFNSSHPLLPWFIFNISVYTVNTSVLSQSESRMKIQHQRLDLEKNWTTEEQNSWLLLLQLSVCCVVVIVLLL